jgi:hypothetical protein
MDDEDGWKRLEEHLLARLSRAGLADLHGLGLRDVCECVLDGVYRIGLGSASRLGYMCVGGGETDLDVEFE